MSLDDIISKNAPAARKGAKASSGGAAPRKGFAVGPRKGLKKNRSSRPAPMETDQRQRAPKQVRSLGSAPPLSSLGGERGNQRRRAQAPLAVRPAIQKQRNAPPPRAAPRVVQNAPRGNLVRFDGDLERWFCTYLSGACRLVVVG
jgi:hypothetical protein